jgi:hypothetical protein
MCSRQQTHTQVLALSGLQHTESVTGQGLIKKHEADMLPQEEALAELLRGMLVRVLPAV